MRKCLNCKQETDNPKFCSRSCAATYNSELPSNLRNLWFLSTKAKAFVKDWMASEE
jgi:hypothetical protein